MYEPFGVTLTAMYVPAKIWRVAAQCNYCNHVLILTELVPRCEGQLSIFNLLKSMAIYSNMSPSPVVGVGSTDVHAKLSRGTVSHLFIR